jgi:hypothetical protein
VDVAALFAYLGSAGDPLTLDAADQRLPGPLRDLLSSVPGKILTISPGGAGLRLDGDVLTISGSSTAPWPVSGLGDATIAVTAAHIRCTSDDVVSGTIDGRLPLNDSVQAQVSVTSIPPVEAVSGGLARGWRIGLASDAAGVTPADLVLLGWAGAEQPVPEPPQLDALRRRLTVPAQGFGVTFYPGTAYQPWLEFEVDVPDLSWTVIDGLLTIDGIGLAARVAVTSWSLAAIGRFSIDKTPMQLTVGLEGGTIWTAALTPAGQAAFPGLAALAAWVGGESLSEATTGGLGSIGANKSAIDAAITAVSARFDWKAGALQQVQVLSLLTLGQLEFDVALIFPDITITGSLHPGSQVTAAGVLASLNLPHDGVPQEMKVTEASFSAAPAHGSYMADLSVDLGLKAGPVTIEEVCVRIAYTAADGLTGLLAGTVGFGTSIMIDLLAEYGGAASGWEFSGRTEPGSELALGDLLDKLAHSFGIPSVPAPVKQLTLTDVLVEYQTGTSAFAFTCTGHLPVAGTPVSATITINVKPAGSGHEAHFGGQLTIGDLELDLFFDEADHGAETFVASAHPRAGDPATVSLHDLVAGVSAEAAVAVPADLVIGLTDVKFVYAKPADSTTPAFAFGIDLSAHVGLAQLPVIGAQLPPDASLEVTGLQLLFSSAKIDAVSAGVANQLLGSSGVIPFPAAGLATGPAFTADLKIGADHESISLGVPAAASLPAVAASGPASQPVGHWFDVHKSIGPVSIGRIGVQYQDGAVFLLIDASLSLAALSVGMDGLGLGSPLTKFAPIPHLDGMSIAFSEGPVSISGGFLVVSSPPKDVSDEFAGELAIAIKAFMISGFGVYARVSGHPSFFAFVEVDGEFGGPPAFFVTGLMGGVGYNWALALPPPDQVYQFPFVSGLGNPAVFGAKPKPLDVLGVLSGQGGQTAWVTPSLGTDWLAAGVQFRSFELIVGRALLVAEFGQGFELAILGLATVTLPQPTQQGAAGTPYAYAELQLEVVLKPDEGVFWAIASLTSNSFLLTKQCQLTGGFAFCVWFGANEHAGDFVLTLGGYHPAFTPNLWYPTVPPVGFHWAVDNSLVIKGAAYFAITPTAAMAGGSLEVVFESGDLRAWLTAHANIMIRWRPFYLTAEVGISIGVSYRLNLGFTSTVLAVELGASLNLWGPPTGGVVHVDWYIISFSISFGADPISEKNLTLDWTGFQALLPSVGHPAQTLTQTLAQPADQPPPAIVTLSVSRGLRSTDSGTGDWIVRADELVLTAASAVPMTSISVGRAVPLPAGAPAAIDIRPMGASQATSPFTITVSGVDDLATWPVSVQSSALPEALWGKPIADDASPSAAAELIGGLPTGVVFAPPPARTGAGVGPFDPGSLVSPVGQGGVLPLRPASQADPVAAPVPDAGSIKAIADNVASGASVAAQARLVSVLAGYAAAPPTNAPLAKLGDQAGAVFAQPPMRTAPA